MALLQIPPYIRARVLAKALKVDVKKVLKEAGAVKRDKRIHWQDRATQRQHEFRTLKEVIFPFTAAHRIGSRLASSREICLQEVEPAMASETLQPVGNSGSAVPRLPVVVVLGHRDHGKTTLIDKLREGRTATAPTEAGGITQRVSGYTAVVGGIEMTLLDTPGHEHFYMMREDGATMADAAAVLVACDQGPLAESWECLERVSRLPWPRLSATSC
jgi:hypothetical protein